MKTSTMSAAKWVTVSQRRSDENNRMIHLTAIYCVLLRNILETVVSDHKIRLILSSVIQLSDGHCIAIMSIHFLTHR